MADISVNHYLGKTPTDLNIVGGTLSSNAEESHLIAEKKTLKQLEEEKDQLLTNIKLKVQNGEISLSEASKLTHDVSIAFDYYNVSDENTHMIHK